MHRPRHRRADLGDAVLAAVRLRRDGRDRGQGGQTIGARREQAASARARRVRGARHRRSDAGRVRRGRDARARPLRRRSGRAARGGRALPAHALDRRGHQRHRVAAAGGASPATGRRGGVRRRGRHRGPRPPPAGRGDPPDRRRDAPDRLGARARRAARDQLADARRPGPRGRLRGRGAPDRAR